MEHNAAMLASATGFQDVVRALVWGNAGLIIVGGFGVWAALSTLGQMKKQVGEMGKQSEFLNKQLDVMKIQADAARENAGATARSVDAFIKKEQARLTVELEPLPSPPTASDILSGVQKSKFDRVGVKIRNIGSTQAFQVQLRATLWASDTPEAEPAEGDSSLILDAPSLVEPGQVVSAKVWNPNSTMDATEIATRKLYLHCRGSFRYKDFLDGEYTDGFNCTWIAWAAFGFWLPRGKLAVQILEQLQLRNC